MKAQKEKLFEQISSQGWTFAKVEDWELEWWADEIWLLESVWSPIDARAYLTFLVDPTIEDWQHRKKGENVSSVEISPLKPTDRFSTPCSFVMSLNQGWEKELPEFLKHLSLFRDESKET